MLCTIVITTGQGCLDVLTTLFDHARHLDVAALEGDVSHKAKHGPTQDARRLGGCQAGTVVERLSPEHRDFHTTIW